MLFLSNIACCLLLFFLFFTAFFPFFNLLSVSPSLSVLCSILWTNKPLNTWLKAGIWLWPDSSHIETWYKHHNKTLLHIQGMSKTFNWQGSPQGITQNMCYNGAMWKVKVYFSQPFWIRLLIEATVEDSPNRVNILPWQTSQWHHLYFHWHSLQ